MIISVLTPTRKRIEQLKLSIDTAISSAHEPEKLEFIHRVDEDDVETIAFLEEYYELVKHFAWGESTFIYGHYICKKYEKDIEMKIQIGMRHKYVFLNRYYDEMFSMAKGEYCLWYSDDMELQSSEKYKGWDYLIRKAEGQFYVFSWFEPKGKINQFPRCYPKKFFELNNRFCANFLEDRFGFEICRFAPIHAPLDMNAIHHQAFVGDGPKDENFDEGRMQWDRTRMGGLESEWQYYSLEDCERMVNYLRENPNMNGIQLSGLPLVKLKEGWPPGIAGTDVTKYSHITYEEWQKTLEDNK
jgi:hypothetical protein